MGSVSQIYVNTPSPQNIFTDTSLGNTAVGVKSSSTLVLYILVDNSANSATTYVKLFNTAVGSVQVGVTVPDKILFVPGGAVIQEILYTSADPGVTFNTALTAAAVTTGGTSGTTSPTSSTIVSISYQ